MANASREFISVKLLNCQVIFIVLRDEQVGGAWFGSPEKSAHVYKRMRRKRTRKETH